MVNYFIIFIVLISHLLSNDTDRKEQIEILNTSKGTMKQDKLFDDIYVKKNNG